MATKNGDIQSCLDNLRDGNDESARKQLLAHFQKRLEKLTKQIRREDFRAVGGRGETDDVFQNVNMRLIRALNDVELKTVRDLENLVRQHIRWELTDLARKYNRLPEPSGSRVALHADSSSGPATKADKKAEDAAVNSAVNSAIEQLPPEDRELVNMLFVRGKTQAEAADRLGVSERTIRRRWRSIKSSLGHLLRHSVRQPSKAKCPEQSL